MVRRNVMKKILVLAFLVGTVLYVSMTHAIENSFVIIGDKEKSEEQLDRLYRNYYHLHIALTGNPSSPLNTELLDELNKLMTEMYRPAFGVAALLCLGVPLRRVGHQNRFEIHTKLAQAVEDIKIPETDRPIFQDDLEKTGLRLLIKGSMIPRSNPFKGTSTSFSDSFSDAYLLFAQLKIGALAYWFELLSYNNQHNFEFEKQFTDYFKNLLIKRPNFFSHEEVILQEKDLEGKILPRWKRNPLRNIIQKIFD